jgi:hypothetical protein
MVIGAFIFLFIWYAASTPPLEINGALVLAAALGALLAIGFNFLNGFIMLRERKNVTVDNLALLGLFIAAYVAYFLYNILKPASASIDFFSLFVDAGMSIFFILYAMSSVGLTLASRAHLDTRLKISSELAATITFFFASGYLVVQALFGTLLTVSWGLIGERIPDIIKLFVFPFVALVMELFFIRRSRKELKAAPIPEAIPLPTVEEEAEPEEGASEIPQPTVDLEDETRVDDIPSSEEGSDSQSEESDEP